MSFFRNIRSSITRGKSSSRDSTPVRAAPASRNPSRPASLVSQSEGRRDSLDSRTDSAILNRGETFILNSDQEDHQRDTSNSSTLEKKSKKSKVLSKFSTFTKRKKSPSKSVSNDATTSAGSFEHHPRDNATNTYYKWNDDGSGCNIDNDAQSDPFNFLYEQHSNLKLLQNGIDSTGNGGKHKNHGVLDSSTYRKGKATSQLKAQLEQLKTLHSGGSELHEEDHKEQEPESEKYKTVTLNSFRKSFRDKYLQQQHEAPHNPAWFVEVESPPSSTDADARYDAKENRPDFLVFKNENYRPGSRSPVRDRNASNNGRSSRSATRSPVKRNETFRVERSAADAVATATKPHKNSSEMATAQCNSNNNASSIRVEIKNSVMPHAVTGRIVPVGVAKPMQSLHNNSGGPYLRTLASTTPYAAIANTPPRLKTSTSPQRNAYKPSANTAPLRAGKYQTLVQISSNHEGDAMTKLPTASTPQTFNRHNTRCNSTRIQFVGSVNDGSDGNVGRGGRGGDGGEGGGCVVGGLNALSSAKKFNNNAGYRYSYAAPASAPIGLTSYELLKQPNNAKPASQSAQQRLKQTYFGGDTTIQPSRYVMSPTSAATNFSAATITTPSFGNNYNYGHMNIGNAAVANISAANSKLRQHSPKFNSSKTLTVSPISAHTNRRDLHQPRFTPVPVQRRSRSPIKMPWR